MRSVVDCISKSSFKTRSDMSSDIRNFIDIYIVINDEYRLSLIYWSNHDCVSAEREAVVTRRWRGSHACKRVIVKESKNEASSITNKLKYEARAGKRRQFQRNEMSAAALIERERNTASPAWWYSMGLRESDESLFRAWCQAQQASASMYRAK